MSLRPLNLFTVSSGCDPLRLIARRVLDGFPFESPRDIPLTQWRILLPSQRSARRMKQVFLEESGGASLLLPRIIAFSDIEEDPENTRGLTFALSQTALVFGLARLVREWAEAHPNLAIARGLTEHARQALALAGNLAQLIAQIETEEVPFESLAALYDFTDLAGHREAVTDLLTHVQLGYTALLATRNRIGAGEHRNRAIREQAKHIASGRARGPFIAAGSTGTNPATRVLLKAIAGRNDGAVILPGLDRAMEEADWKAISPTHPQFGLKGLIAELGVSAKDVAPLAADPVRLHLIREMMRPSPRTDQWVAAIAARPEELRAAFAGISLVETEDRHRESLAIALILREAIEDKGKRAALVTPDRDLALRVAADLRRWNIEIEDSAGEPLTRHGLASLLAGLLECVMSGYAPAAVISLLHHGEFSFSPGGNSPGALARCLDLAARQHGLSAGPHGLAMAVARAQAQMAADDHVHPVLRRVPQAAWQAAAETAQFLATMFAGLDARRHDTLAGHIQHLREALAGLCPAADMSSSVSRKLDEELNTLSDNADGLGAVALTEAAAIILQHLAGQTLHLPKPVHPRLAIYGLAEARMMQADTVVLGGLVEGKWPAQPDTGPWLNRPMRAVFGLSPPEREIGLTAHDFAEGLACDNVYVTWPRRISRQPVVPSRWVLRLRALLQGIAIAPQDQLVSRYTTLARQIDAAPGFKPRKRPAPSPAIALRPTHFSVTEIEKLIRDPYSIFARRILRLDPLRHVSPEPGAALRGTLFHGAIDDWNRQWPHRADSLERLLAAGQRQFAPHMADPAIAGFWWPRFVRVAQDLVAASAAEDDGVRQVFSELRGVSGFNVRATRHTLSARMDRLDILQDGTARLTDYKTGEIPTGRMVASGLSPQLTLQAWMLSVGAFTEAGTCHPSRIQYVQIGGGRPAIETTDVLRDGKGKMHTPLLELAKRHFAVLQEVLSGYLEPASVYVPRARQFKVDTVSDFDHLSRYREWQLADGGKP